MEKLLSKVCHNKYTKDDVIDLEKDILITIGFKIRDGNILSDHVMCSFYYDIYIQKEADQINEISDQDN